jgi:cysteine desulfuration protein SufE
MRREVGLSNGLDIAELIEAFDLLPDWEQRYAFVIELSPRLSSLPAALRCDRCRVKGCVTPSWIHGAVDDALNGHIVWQGDADSDMARGFMCVLFALYAGKTPQEVLAFDPAPQVARLGLDQHLSPQRRVGLFSAISHMQAIARALC